MYFLKKVRSFNKLQEVSTNFENGIGLSRSKLSPTTRINIRFRRRLTRGSPLNPQYSLTAHISFKKIMETLVKGRPKKDENKIKPTHYSVWVTAQEKKLLDIEIEKSNLSASQFFVVLALNSPIKRPKKKSLPQIVADKITSLEKLSGLLSLSALKAKDKEMIANDWRESSQNIRFLSKIITAWIFEDFEFPQHRKTMESASPKLEGLYSYLKSILPDNENKKSVLEMVSSLYHKNIETLKEYDAHFEFNELPKDISSIVWESNENETHLLVHEQITDLILSFVEQSKR